MTNVSPLPGAGQDGLVGQYTNITTNATTTVKSGNGKLIRIIFNGPVATGTVTIYDNTAASGTKIGTITTPASPQPQSIEFGLSFNTGLTIVTATAAQDITVVWG